jgi:hypothetical protein
MDIKAGSRYKLQSNDAEFLVKSRDFHWTWAPNNRDQLLNVVIDIYDKKNINAVVLQNERRDQHWLYINKNTGVEFVNPAGEQTYNSINEVPRLARARRRKTRKLRKSQRNRK